MPFQSKYQMKFMFANYPGMAQRWAKETPKYKKAARKEKRRTKKETVIYA